MKCTLFDDTHTSLHTTIAISRAPAPVSPLTHATINRIVFPAAKWLLLPHTGIARLQLFHGTLAPSSMTQAKCKTVRARSRIPSQLLEQEPQLPHWLNSQSRSGTQGASTMQILVSLAKPSGGLPHSLADFAMWRVLNVVPLEQDTEHSAQSDHSSH
eukprot:CAMPEP_0197643636 /NCGR_PEP_ID=MMETSP1338-20131121/16881_1 /TAXON_ID=43686 ORGANISM="Pelagodinium beii, Strain RCC1491" /NCGR_SAMPLE_ID=MMETSP1338 /ASSEMBLY_ACC=CAM_ASM_000754 /LENGTH=156 /DNA_ID=CAMNT_0043216909 /DNA_START=927 /DNA_END=1398 /DNA_ORIENTATION=-